ncbi:hypothetical protein [Arsenicicoccus sp. UBA7492]|uniref:hypothetical protein n=1 Tax=Arsenicicoccus sp. UBA7492 TaxID=1946057 RepID=UPI00257E969A|nr:hypothetical protein [Arsenicicoccus sp. UBA7492]
MKALSRFVVPALALLGIVLLTLGLRQTPATQSSPTSPETSLTSPRPTSSAAVPGTGSATAARPPASASSIPAPASTVGSASATSSAPTGDLDDTGVELTVPAAPGPVDRAVMGSAKRFMQVFARPGAGEQASWWARVKPLLTSQAALDYEGTDPAAVPVTTATGQPMLVPMPADSPTNLVAMVAVPTDVGVYTVHVRTVAPYQVTRITPPRR